MDLQFLGVVYGLASALSWGAGDFSGGLGSRRSNAFSVVLLSEFVGLALLGGLALLLAQPLPATADLMWSAGAGVAGTIGLVSFYRALAGGRMAVVAPITGMVSAAVPVLWGAVVEGAPGPQQLAGFGLAAVALWLVSGNGGGTKGAESQALGMGLALLAGAGFGAFFILIDHVSSRAILWPLVASRSASIALLLLAFIPRRTRPRLALGQWPLALLAGCLDSAGNALYALASRAGRLDVAAVLSSLYPAVTVLLARSVLHEPVSRRQGAGVLAALAAVVLIAS